VATSTIPATLDSLIAALRARPGLVNAVVHDGTPITDEGTDYVAIGWSDEDSSSVTARQEPATLGNLRRSETYDINCQACAWDGSTDMAVARTTAFALFAEVEDALREDGTIAGNVIFADIGNYTVRQVQTTGGALVAIDFSIAVKITRI
jgi:hypothetical protein